MSTDTRPAALADPEPCQHCDGGRIPFEGTPGAYYRDGEKYDPPGWEDCEVCGGTGEVS